MAENTQTEPVVEQVAPEQPAVQNDENQGDINAATPPANGLPEEVSERTKSRFEELTKQLADERRSREALEQAYRTLQTPKEQPKAEPENQIDALYDDETGLLNEQALTSLQQRTFEAEKAAQEAKAVMDKFLQDKQSQETQEFERKAAEEAYTSHPELNPTSETFNKDLSDITSSLILQSMLHPEKFDGKELTFKQAGDKAKAMVAKIAGNAKAEGANEALEQLSQKELASLETTGSPTRRQDVINNQEELRKRSRKGDLDAFVARMRGVSQG